MIQWFLDTVSEAAHNFNRLANGRAMVKTHSVGSNIIASQYEARKEVKMQKSEFIEHVAKQAGVTKSEADKVVRATLEVIKETLAAGDKVTLVGFGSFEVRERGERTVTSIRSKEKVTVPATKLPAFSPGSELKSAVSGKSDGKK